jgi:CRISPR-associated protein Cas8b/Csh1 subtype I-B
VGKVIDSFKRIGEEITKDFVGLPELERKKSVLNLLTIPVKEDYEVNKQKKPIYEIVINFDTKKNEIIFRADEQLRKEKRGDYFGFKAGSNTRGKRTYFTTNRISYHLSNTIPDTIKYIEDDIKDCDYDFSEFKEFLENIKKKFYEKSIDEKGKVKYFLNRQLYSEQTNDEVDFILKKIGIPKGEFGNFDIFSLNFDGKSILETKYAEIYINLRYYYSIEKFFKYQTKKGIKEEKCSHLSSKMSHITKNVDIPLKFYITDQEKTAMFENFDINNSYKSFCLNQPEYENLLIGCNFILENLKNYFNKLSFLIIPKSEMFFKDLEKETKIVRNKLQNIEGKGAQKNHSIVREIEKVSEYDNFYFDFMFYKKGKSDFNIFKIISDISVLRLNEIDQKMTDVATSKIRRKWNLKYDFSLNTIWKSLYNQLVKDVGKEKQKIYRSDFLEYLDIIYSNRKIKEEKFIRDLLKNIKKGVYPSKKSKSGKKSKSDDNYFLVWDSFESLIFFRKLNIIGGLNMDVAKNKLLVELNNNEIKEFFNAYPEIFGENSPDGMEKKGLILLGYLINQIVWAQKGKSSTFLNKINYDGIKKEKIKMVENEVIEFLKMYNTQAKPLLLFNSNIIAAMQESLLQIEQTSLKKEEITYYILLGVFVASQIGIQKSKKKDGGIDYENRE